MNSPIEEPIAGDASFYAVAKYDATRDPALDLEHALVRAQQESRRVLLIVGGDWCRDCVLLDQFIAEHEEIRKGIAQSFLIVKVSVSKENLNQTFLGQFPGYEWVPHFYVLDSQGELLTSYDTRALAPDRCYDVAKVLAFVEEWRR